MYEFTEIMAACKRPAWAHSRSCPSTEMGSGRKVPSLTKKHLQLMAAGKGKRKKRHSTHQKLSEQTPGLRVIDRHKTNSMVCLWVLCELFFLFLFV